jgi:calcineurin-like phosphoesterase family protein
MTKDIIEAQNDLLSPGDEIFHIGDWAWGSKSNIRAYELLMKRMRDDVSRHLILGNHDALKPFTYVNLGFTSVHTSLIVRLPIERRTEDRMEIDVYLIHDPSAWTVLPNNSILFCGHVHGLFDMLHDGPTGKMTLNVGVDIHNFKPVEAAQALEMLGVV